MDSLSDSFKDFFFDSEWKWGGDWHNLFRQDSTIFFFFLITLMPLFSSYCFSPVLQTTGTEKIILWNSFCGNYFRITWSFTPEGYLTWSVILIDINLIWCWAWSCNKWKLPSAGWPPLDYWPLFHSAGDTMFLEPVPEDSRRNCNTAIKTW